MLIENGIVRVGVEIEIARFRRDRSHRDAVARLLALGHMEGVAGNWETVHQYNCRCEMGCSRVRSGEVLIPQLVSVQYDATLPATGAEFIISPTLIIDGMAEVRGIWEAITEDAVWDNTMENRNGGRASPSIHLHVSAQRPDARVRTLENRIAPPTADVLHAFSLFAPELVMLSDIEEFRRGLAFRQPTRTADGRAGHHGFIQVKDYIPGDFTYIEWRMFEAAYQDWEYFEASAYMAAALTRAFLNEDMFHNLMREGYTNPPDFAGIEAASQLNSTGALLALADRGRMDTLRQVIHGELDDDPYGQNVVRNHFARTEATHVFG